MTRALSIARKILSWKTRFQVTDETDTVLYECTWKFGWPSRSWVLYKNGEEVAIFRRKIFSFSPTWLVSVDGCDFRLRKKLFTFRRRLVVEDGPFDGAELTGGLFDMGFDLVHNDESLARAHAKVFTIRERLAIELVNDAPEVELLTALMMANLLVQKDAEADERHGSELRQE